MGLFSSLFGSGGKSVSQSGFGALPLDIQNQFKPYAGEISKYTNPTNPGVIDSFTPMDATTDENKAFSLMRQGFTPTADSLKSDMSMMMNPYQDSVIGEINRQGTGDFSLLKQALGEAGQSGSSNYMTGANDIDLSRMDKIGSFLSNQFNTNLGYAMHELPGMRSADAQNMLGIGDFMRNLDMAKKQAPVSALESGMELMAPWFGGSVNVQKGATDGILGTLAKFVSPMKVG